MPSELLYTACANKKTIKNLRIGAAFFIILALLFCFNYVELSLSAKEQIANEYIALFLPILIIIIPLGIAISSLLYANALSKHCIYLYKDRISGYGFVDKARVVSFDLKKEQINNIHMENKILCINVSGVIYKVETEAPDTFLAYYRRYTDK